MSSEILSSSVPYRVLARKYRPQNFDQLIGQDALVRTLKNAIETGRIAHAFMLTGVRGVGKTTTARIIAKALNYTGPDGTSGPTTGPTDDCDICKSITEDRHPDVMEMDAASRTGVDDIREILDGVRYAPTSARYKIYIIDEVHMLSKNAFNALLKTLEEPPPHVKFIFATTEIRKVPVTVLSRCQRFDLRRVDVDTLKKHFSYVCDSEKVSIEDEALNLIARAADGSVRDGLSLLDQAISMNSGNVTSASVQAMLGLADRGLILDLYEHIAHGRAAESLSSLAHLYSAGADPASLVQDLLDLTHLMTKFKATDAPPQTVEPNMSAGERTRAAAMSSGMSMSILGRFWTLLLKGMNDVQTAPNGQSALEMLVLRLLYAADLPDPSIVLDKIKQDGGASSSRKNMRGASLSGTQGHSGASVTVMSSHSSSSALPKIEAHASAAPQMVANNNLNTLQDVVSLLEQNGALILASEVFSCVELVTLKDTHIECSLTKNASPKLPSELAKKLSEITGQRWIVSISKAQGAPTLKQQEQERAQHVLASIQAHPLVSAVTEAFPGAEIISISDLNS